MTGQRWMGYAVLAAIGLVVRVILYPPMALGVGVLVYPLAYWGTRRSLASFPWTTLELPEELQRFKAQYARSVGREEDSTDDQLLGWPFGVLQFTWPTMRISIADAWAISLLVSWSAYVLGTFSENRDIGMALLGCSYFLIAGVCVMWRLIIYCTNYRSPINLWGRLWTLRWIVPEHDVVFLGPLAAFFTATLGLYLLLTNGAPPQFAWPAALGLTMFVTLTSRPTLEAWRLTGGHRIVPGKMQKNQYIEL